MTRETAIKMIKSKLLCASCEIVGSSTDCDNCRLNYEQGNLGEQQEWLAMALAEMQKPERPVAHWTRRKTWIHDGELYCSNCENEAPTEKGTSVYVKSAFCPHCGAKMNVEE